MAPGGITASLTAVKESVDQGSPALDQLAYADMLEHGEVDAHLRRMRPVYRRRRDALLAALAASLPELEPAGASAGLHVLAYLPAGLDEAAIVRAAAADGIAVYGLTPRRIAPGRPGLVFGYGQVPESAIEDGIRRLATVIRAAAGRGA